MYVTLDCESSLEEQGKDVVLRRKFWSHSGGRLRVVTPLKELLLDLQNDHFPFLKLKLSCLCKKRGER